MKIVTKLEYNFKTSATEKGESSKIVQTMQCLGVVGLVEKKTITKSTFVKS